MWAHFRAGSAAGERVTPELEPRSKALSMGRLTVIEMSTFCRRPGRRRARFGFPRADQPKKYIKATSAAPRTIEDQPPRAARRIRLAFASP